MIPVATLLVLLALAITLFVILERTGKIMGQLEDLAMQFDTETTAIATRLDTLNAELAAAKAAGAPPDPATLAKLQAVSDRLKALGSDPTNPIPAPVTPASP